MFHVVSMHMADFGAEATWDYLEAGHGKGPCDGLGSSVKRSADMAVKQGRAFIPGLNTQCPQGATSSSSQKKTLKTDKTSSPPEPLLGRHYGHPCSCTRVT
jgi:hypothetical protein